MLLLEPENTAGTYVGATMIGLGVVDGFTPLIGGLVPGLKINGVGAGVKVLQSGTTQQLSLGSVTSLQLDGRPV